MAELLPCPFCGSTRIGVHMYRQRRSSGYKALCLECGISQSGVCRPSIEAAQAAWNTRATPPPAGAQQAVAISDEQIIRAIQEVLRGYSIFSPVLLANQVGTWNPEDVLTKEGRAIADRILALAAPAAAQAADEALLRDLTQLASECSDHTPESFQRGVMALSTRAHKVLRDADRARRLAEIAATPAPEAARQETDSARLAWLHTSNKDAEGYEFGVCKVKFDASGKLADFLWAASDSSDVDAAMLAAKEVA